MTRHANAAKDLAALLADASPDVAAANAPALAALRAETAADLANAHVAAMLRTTGEASVAAARRLEGDAPTEHDEQVALFAWAAENEEEHPELRNLFAVPNGAKVPYTRDSKGRTFSPQRVELVAEGLRRGVPDMMLAVMRRGSDGRTWGGLFIEMKRKPNKPTSEQQEWIARLRASGYMAVVCYGCEEAKQCIMAYLTQEVQP